MLAPQGINPVKLCMSMVGVVGADTDNGEVEKRTL